VEDIGIQVCASGPHDRTELRVDFDLGEDGGIAQRCEDSFKPKATGEIQLTCNPILEAQVEPVVTQRLYLYDILQHDLTLAAESPSAARAREPDPNSPPPNSTAAVSISSIA